nr:sensor domain-containing diguanylate cyclase [Clostridium gallinarum]
MLEIGKKIISSITLGDIFKVISREINKVIKHDGIEIVAYDNKSKSYKIELAIEENNVVELKESKILDDTLIKYSIDNKEEIIINDIFKEYYHYIKDIERYNKFVAERYPKWKNESNSNSAMIIPIIIKNNVIGCISVYSYESNAYAMKDLVRFKILSAYIGIALENSKLYKEVEYNANYDALTNIYNRRRSIYKINKIRNNIDKISGKYYLAMIDIDNFKKINDVYGHNAGDKILVEVSKLIKENIDKKDILGRYGGEEFILVFDGKNDYIKILEDIRIKIENLKIKYQDSLISVTVSIGVEELYDSSRTLEENVSIADKKLYKAKNTTKNLVVY